MIDLRNRWVELKSFEAYREWKTPRGFLCGTYASSVLLAYWQDQLDEQCSVNQLREKNSSQNDALIRTLQAFLQPIDYPTVPIQISLGLNRFFRRYHIPYRARATTVGSWQRTTKRIAAGEPVMIGLLQILGSKYKNHWVVAHGFMETSDGQRFYKIHDNWGKSAAIVPAKWVNGTISLVSQKKP
ncbi:hypothetical protein [Enterococcus dongliensis]|uniref:hypothetical protein n=1 Tax=Enterococcus dongliensis TaxID=2559925 RepID=UPI002891B75B|nr:hypothetical protein [Enterococcus dongliensis]MDT2673142.1 hypothetical protein [Enterococcus dongliensis]